MPGASETGRRCNLPGAAASRGAKRPRTTRSCSLGSLGYAAGRPSPSLFTASRCPANASAQKAASRPPSHSPQEPGSSQVSD